MDRHDCLAAAMALAGTVVLQGCATVPTAGERAAPSALGCMRATVRERLPTGLDDKLAHCVASGLIVRHCSASEALLAGWGKELRDLLGAGDAQRTDLAANRKGRRCARSATSDQALIDCCLDESAGE